MKSRAEAFQSIADRAFDLCVIGGGATGAGCALDAQLRGLHTILIEANDFASGASGASTKIVHGGVRYLQEAITHLDVHQYRVVKRALRERARMLANAPFLTRTIQFVIPCFSRWEVFYYGVGMKIYDWTAGAERLVPSRRVNREEAMRALPGLKAERLMGAVTYSDGQFDDCRYGITLVQTFVENGGEALNHATVVGFEKDAKGKIVAVRAREQFSSSEFRVRAKEFVNATGAASDEVREMAHPGIAGRMMPSKGAHIVLPMDGFVDGEALLIPSTEDGRVIFAISWRGRLLVGTTDEAARADDEMTVTEPEVDYLLRYVNRYLRRPFSREEILGGGAGVRPLVGEKGKHETQNLIRDHEVEVDEASGLISILGGKWTTYRVMAEDAIDAVQERAGGRSPCRTRDFLLAGSEHVMDAGASAREYGVGIDITQHLIGKFGSRATRILEIAKNEPAMRALVIGQDPVMGAEIAYCVREEMAMTIEDVLARRIGMQLLSWRDAMNAATIVGRIMARELGWTKNEEESAVGEYVAKMKRLMSLAGGA
jgi:glycerol-3-phosphate dehydrogenase